MSEQGEAPEDVYVHLQRLLSAAPGGPHGQTFAQSAMEVETPGLRARLRRLLRRLAGRA